MLAAQAKGIEMSTSEFTPNEAHDGTVRVLVDGMVHLDVIAGPVDEAIQKEIYKKYYMHKTGHWPGVDVHDVGAYRKDKMWRKFQPGMVTTVEPGLYLPDDDESLPAAFRGIGIRIEDDIHITKSGPENLTSMVPKTVAEIEDLTHVWMQPTKEPSIVSLSVLANLNTSFFRLVAVEAQVLSKISILTISAVGWKESSSVNLQ